MGSPLLEPCEYARHPTGNWYACTPTGQLAGLAKHDVIEHGDGTITVSPSILVMGGYDSDDWHGYLEQGVWRQIDIGPSSSGFHGEDGG